MLRRLLIAAAFLSLCLAEVNLPFGDVNVVVVTDVHSWVAGHSAHEPALNVDYGDVISFYEHLKELSPNQDVFFVMNGDFVDGTGLSTIPPSHLTPILQFMNWDALNIGNHELYLDKTVQFMTQQGGFVDHWNEKYLTSNVVLSETKQPIGSRFTYLKGKSSTILTFGFLYNMMNHCNITLVEQVQDVVQADWFLQALATDFDAILVLAHMDVKDPLVYVILDVIREVVGPDMPVQFITGHTHYRSNVQLDAMATSFEAGRYLDTVGFVSFPTIQSNASIQDFDHVFLDANTDTLKNTLGVDKLKTSSGSALSSLIHQTRQDLGLLDVIGCSMETLYLQKGLDEPHSLWPFFLREVVLRNYLGYNQTAVFLLSTGSMRYDLFEGNVTVDDLIAVAPFNDTISQVSQQTLGFEIFELVERLNSEYNQSIGFEMLPLWALSSTIDNDTYYDLFTESISAPHVQSMYRNVTRNSSWSFTPIPQYHNGQAVTTTGLWFDYVNKYWSCEDSNVVEVTNRWWLVGLSVVAAILFFGYRYWMRRFYRRQGYEASADLALVEEVDDDDVDGIL